MHPTPDELRTLSLGEASPELIERIEQHVYGCGDCAVMIVRLLLESMGSQPK